MKTDSPLSPQGYTDSDSSLSQDITYETSRVDGTPFSLAVAYTEHPLQYRVLRTPSISLETARRRLHTWWRRHGLLTKLHRFSCNDSRVVHDILHTDATLTSGKVFRYRDNSYCNTKVFSVLTDLQISDQFSNAFLQSPGINITARFIITYNGFVFFDNSKWNLTSESDLKSLAPFSKVMKNLLGVKYYVGLPRKHGGRGYETLNVTERIEMEGMLVAAAGFEIEYSSFLENVFRLSQSNMDTEILLLDENGYMVARNSHHSRSRHIGEQHPYLLEELVRRKIYTKHSHVECITECVNLAKYQFPFPQPRSGACSSVSLLTETLRTLLLVVQLIWHALLISLVSTQHDPGSHVQGGVVRAAECCKEYTHYERDFSNVLDFSLFIPAKCPCGASYTISPLPDTNLLSVKRSQTPFCECADSSKRVKPPRLAQGQETIILQMCYNATYQHRFRPSKTCILDHGDLTSPGCSGALRTTHHTFIIIVIFLHFYFQ